MQIKYSIALLYGLISGLISTVLFTYINPDSLGENSWIWLPGTVFGIVYSSYFLRKTPFSSQKIKYSIGLLFVGLSTGAYYLAVCVASILHGTKIYIAIQGVLAGLCGSFILILAIWICTLKRPDLNKSLTTLLFGGILGSLLCMGLPTLFIIWQSIMFLCLASHMPPDEAN